MNIEIYFVEKIVDSDFENQIWEILCECDKDFVPSLSSRENTYQTENLHTKGNTDHIKPYSYFEELKKQYFLVALEKANNQVVGFLSFKHNYVCEQLIHCGPSNYSTTTCVSKKYRNMGIGRRLYEFLEYNLNDGFKTRYVTRRTWSTNLNQLHLFKNMGYEIVYTIKNHRGIGVDTLYFAKEVPL